jgi:hypothetical protein
MPPFAQDIQPFTQKYAFKRMCHAGIRVPLKGTNAKDVNILQPDNKT